MSSSTIPTVEKWIIRWVIAPKLRRFSAAKARDIFIEEGKKILRLSADLPESALRQRVQIKRIPGLDPVSTNWSVSMTIEHLIIVANAIMPVIESLRQNKKPAGAASMAAVKPQDRYTGAQARQSFEQLVTSWPNRFDLQALDQAPGITFDHPWFGPLNAAGWYKMLATHQRLHRQQIEKIIAGLD
ncbi:MAG: DinB family protein [Alphaproteobacteria bacterium]|nr:MAG: DinB family protein [Alphaproteobacteria bacterium]